MTEEEFKKAQRKDAWLVHSYYGLVKASGSPLEPGFYDQPPYAWICAGNGGKKEWVRIENLRLATANDFLKENL